MVKISTAIIALNEEENIKTAVRSALWTDEVVVVDSGSTDRTIEICRDLGAHVIEQEWLGFGRQKQFAAEQCANDWILSIDADEEISSSLEKEILELIETGSLEKVAGYLIPRQNEYMGRPIRHSGWYPDYQLRLFDRKQGVWRDLVIHESVEVSQPGKVHKLKNNILHRTVDSVIDHHRMIGERYAPLGAKQMELDGKRVSVVALVLAGPLTFVRTYFLKLGMLDGLPGFCIAAMAGYHAFLKRLLRYESQQSAPAEKG
ncbi:MAG: glycosyltransferase family 2 protein [Acidobacteriota bacterium]|nr:glycosyltransferase family 2 protein [Acidobacteriota bacterium]MDH3531129.1 glycosyltransferase family 2 protein [Acidobacteriota bacterium]